MHTIDTNKYNLRTDLIIEKENIDSAERETIKQKNTTFTRCPR